MCSLTHTGVNVMTGDGGKLALFVSDSTDFSPFVLLLRNRRDFIDSLCKNDFGRVRSQQY